MDKKQVARGVGVGVMALAVTGVLAFSVIKAFRAAPPAQAMAMDAGPTTQPAPPAIPAKATGAKAGPVKTSALPAPAKGHAALPRRKLRTAAVAPFRAAPAAAAPLPPKAKVPKAKVPEAQRRAHAVFMLNALRNQVALYKLQHDGTAPDFGRYPAWEQMLDTTRADGTLGAGDLGPYLRSMPINPLNGHGRVAVVAADVKPGQRVRAEGVGFVFSRATGRIWCTDAIGRIFNDVAAEPTLAVVRAEVQRLRAQVALYKLEHVDTPPDLRQHPRWAQLMQRTRADGRIDPEGPFGPYLRRAPINVLNQSSEVDVVEKIPRAGYVPNPKKRAGFVYESNTGMVWATDDQWKLIVH